MAAKRQAKESNVGVEKNSSEAGMASSGSVEVIGLLGLATLIYATLALFFIS